MAFTSDHKGGLLYSLASDEIVDQDAYGMLRNNAPEYILAFSLKQMNERRELEYDVRGMYRARDFFAGHVFNRQQMVSVLMGVAGAFAEAEEYMLSPESFANSLDTAFLDDNLNVRLAYVPVIGYTGCAGARIFLRDVRRNLETSRDASDCGYLNAIDSALNDAEGFTVAGFKKLLVSLTLKPKQNVDFRMKSAQGFVSPDLPVHSNSDVAGGAIPGTLPANGVQDAPSSASGGVNAGLVGMAVPSGGGAAGVGNASGASGGGMAVPGMDGQWQQGAPDADGGKGRGLFGRRKKEGPAKAEKASKQAKKEAKAAEKAARAEAKAAKKAAKANGRPKKSSLPFARDKSMKIPVGPSREGDASNFAIPGQDGLHQGSSVPGGDERGFELGRGGGGLPGVAPDGGGYASQQFDFGASDGSASLTGDQYNDHDFGVTEVYGIPNVVEKLAGQGSVAERREPELNVVPSLPVTAYLYRKSTGENRLIDKTPFKVGRRRSEVDFHIAEKPKVSRVHAIITFADSRFSIRDNDSVNHTKVNGARLGAFDSIPLKDGDRIEMGDEEFVFRMG